MKNEKQMNIDLEIGLTNQQVQERIVQGFVNTNEGRITKSYKEILRDNFLSLFNLINAILAGMIIFIGSFKNLLFLGVVVSNLGIGMIQELRAKRILDKLSLITQPIVKVIRERTLQEIHMDDLVLDDISCLSSGCQICADAIVKEGKLEVNESLITGESDVVVKHEGDIIYSGSFVVSGKCKAQVIHVGKDNYASTIMADAKTLKRHKSQLRDSINFIIKTIGIIIIPIGILLFCKQYFLTDTSFAEAIISTVAALVGMIPEGLVLLTSVALAVGSINLAKHKTLVQELYCIETLARVDMLCLDKTGTITQGCMSVEQLLVIQGSEEEARQALASIMYALEDDNATALAIKEYVQDTPYATNITQRLPFSSARKCSAISLKEKGTYSIGAYEFLKVKKDAAIEQKVYEQSMLGNRVLILAHHPSQIQNEVLPEHGSILALIMLSDPIRKEAPQTLDYFLSQGVEVKVISGDDPKTVHEIARKANLKNYDKYIDVSTLKDEDIPNAVQAYTVFGRVSPVQKKLMIKALKQQGHITAMIGDGVNDVMALKEADCSISVAQGSEAAKNIANLVLLDNNFANMPRIVDEGRRVINNIQRAASLFLVKTTFSTILSFLTLFFLPRYPFQPIQLTLISSVTIGIPSLFLALEANHARVEGNFLFNVLGRAFPGAICVVLSILYVNVLQLFFSISSAVMSTMCVFLTGTSSLIVLYRVCMPFTKKRLAIFISMTLLFVLQIILLPNIYSIVWPNHFQTILTIAGMVVIPFVMDSLYRLGNYFKLKDKLIHAIK